MSTFSSYTARMFLTAAFEDRRLFEAEQTIQELQEKRARHQSCKVINQPQVVEWLGKGLIVPEELSDDEHIAIYGLTLGDLRREREAWEALKGGRGSVPSRMMRSNLS